MHQQRYNIRSAQSRVEWSSSAGVLITLAELVLWAYKMGGLDRIARDWIALEWIGLTPCYGLRTLNGVSGTAPAAAAALIINVYSEYISRKHLYKIFRLNWQRLLRCNVNYYCISLMGQQAELLFLVLCCPLSTEGVYIILPASHRIPQCEEMR